MHNDYINTHPLADAVALGYRGVEADVFLIDGVLRVAHDRKAARRGPTLDTLYLLAIREMLARCSAPEIRGGPPFLLNIEVKEQSLETLQAVRNILASYRDLLATSDAPPSSQSRLIVTLVGFAGYGADSTDSLIGVSCKLQKIAAISNCLLDSRNRMLSLEYGKTLGRWWTLDSERQHWLEALRVARNAAPGVLIRAFDVPPNSEIYAELFRAGVDLIGTKDLVRTRQLLTALSRTQRPPAARLR